MEIKRLILVRHGEAKHHVNGMTGGWTDSSLTDLGLLQAKATGHTLAVDGIGPESDLISSDLLRARQTTTAIARSTKQTAEYHTELRELNNGVAANKTIKEANLLSLPVTHPSLDELPYPGAESWRMMAVRIVTFLDKMAAICQTQTVVIVSHSLALIPVVCWWLRLGSEWWSSVSFDFECGSISILSINRWGERTISKLNDISHLPEQKRTPPMGEK
jgi:broad specificity phosphatase PhoE